MWFGGYQPFTLSDYPGHMAAIVFTQGCNFRCPYCHNAALIRPESEADNLIAEETILERLKARQGSLQGLVVTGGEPTIHAALPGFLEKVKALPCKVKLDTNGSRPDRLRLLLARGLVDYIAMDIKAPLASYDRLCGVRVPALCIKESIMIIANSGLPHQFRTTAVTPLLGPDDMESVKALVPKGSLHVINPFQTAHALEPALRNATDNRSAVL